MPSIKEVKEWLDRYPEEAEVSYRIDPINKVITLIILKDDEELGCWTI